MRSRMTDIAIHIPIAAADLIEREAKRRNCSQSKVAGEYLLGVGLGMDDDGPKVPLRVKDDIQRLKRLAFDLSRKLRERD